MAVYPRAVNLLIPRGTVGGAGQQPRIRPTIIILHTNVGAVSLASARNLMINTTKGQEYHYQVEIGGRLGQYVDTTIRADNNYKANSFTSGGVLCGAVSIETADRYYDGDQGLNLTWTQLGQRANIEDLLVWLCQTHGIPARVCPDPYSPGIGYHSLWGYNTASNPDKNPWTTERGKTCPGPGKISEFPSLVTAVARRVAGGTEEDFMTEDDQKWMMEKLVPATAKYVWDMLLPHTTPGTAPAPANSFLRATFRSANDLWEGDAPSDVKRAEAFAAFADAAIPAITAAVAKALEEVTVTADVAPGDIAAIAAATAAAVIAEIAS